jgi:tetratricopeptide (TPR) repeat protein
VLHSRLNHGPDADAAFQYAEKLFKAESNQEGLAELDFQRGYTYNDRSDPTDAKVFLQRALDAAPALDNLQLEIRSHTQLSSAATATGHLEEGVVQAQQAIRLARDNRLDQWAADGLGRLASATMKQGKLSEAEDTAREALQVARRTGQLRAQALANATLASIMSQRHRSDQVIAPAQAALDYYKSHGFFKPAAYTALLLVRTQRDKGEYREALKSAYTSLDVAARSGDNRLQLLAEEAVASVSSAMEDYPNAFTHYNHARTLAENTSDRTNQSAHCAEMLLKLGRYEESEVMLESMLPTPSMAAETANIRLGALLSRQKYREALDLARNTLAVGGPMDADDRHEIEVKLAIAEMYLGQKASALKLLDDLTGSASSPGEVWQRKLTSANVDFQLGRVREAQVLALEVGDHFIESGQLDSALRSLGLAASASRLLADFEKYSNCSKKAVDIMARLEQNWGSQPFHVYLSQPDLRSVLRDVKLGR